VERRFTSCVARCDALVVGVGWSGPTGRTGGSSRPMLWTGVSMREAQRTKPAVVPCEPLADAADWVTCLHDRLSNEPPRGPRVQVDGQ